MSWSWSWAPAGTRLRIRSEGDHPRRVRSARRHARYRREALMMARPSGSTMARRFVASLALPLAAAGPSRLAQPASAETPLRVVGLRTEYKENPLGIDARKPRLSWRIESARARSRPVGLRDPGGAERAWPGDQGRAGVGVGEGQLGRVDPSPLWRPGTGVGPAVLLAGSGVGWEREGLGVERACVVGDGPSLAFGLEGELDRAGPAGGRDEVGSGADAAAGVPG